METVVTEPPSEEEITSNIEMQNSEIEALQMTLNEQELLVEKSGNETLITMNILI